ncbi:hypothetical protein C8J56DRAFT_969954 [Mycena floridula]|nr:hypothetical protein C8J56DRAFT_969954 [Mycena floridula]
MLVPRLVAADSTTPFVTPSTWKNTGIVTAPAQRVRLAQAAIDKSVSQLNSTNGQVIGGNPASTAVLYNNMATFDQLTNQTKYRDQLKALFTTVDSLNPGFANLDTTYGYAAANAYATYKDAAFLTWAQQDLRYGLNYTLTQQELDGTQKSPRNFTLQAQCSGITMANGSFTSVDFNDAKINALSTGNAAIMAESTGDKTLLATAQAAANFIRSHLLSAQNIVLDTISAQASDNCGITNSELFAYNQGLMVEGLAILSSLNPGDADTQNLLYSTILPAATYPDWHTNEGVIVTGSLKTGDDRLIRGAIAAYNRNPTNKDLRSYLRDYLGVQYNAVLNEATTGNDIYSLSWLGPPTDYSPDGQNLAISVLLAAISLQNDTTPTQVGATGVASSTISGTGVPQAQTSDAPHKSNAGAIAGGVIGGLAIIALIIGAFIFLRRRRNSETSEVIYAPTPAILPVTGERRQPQPAYQRSLSPMSEFTDRSRNILSPSEFAGSSDAPSTGRAEPSHSLRNPGDDLLVQMLAARLQSSGPRWDEGQAPPGYQPEPDHDSVTNDNSSSVGNTTSSGNEFIDSKHRR